MTSEHFHLRQLEGLTTRSAPLIKEKIRARREGKQFGSMSGWRKTGFASVIVALLTSTKKIAYSKKSAYGIAKI